MKDSIGHSCFSTLNMPLCSLLAPNRGCDRVADMGFNDRGRRIFRLAHDTGLEDLAQRASRLLTEFVRFGPGNSPP